MGQLNFISKYNINEGLVMSPSTLKDLYLYGIPIVAKTGEQMSDVVISTYIRSAQDQIENYLGVKLNKQIIEESLSFYWNDWRHWGYLPTTYQVREAYKLEGYVGNVKQVEYSSDWLVARSTNDKKTYWKQIHMIPAGSAQAQTVVFTGVMPYTGYRGIDNTPMYWRATYCTGYDPVPSDILTALGQLASLFIFNQLGDIILGAGIASFSLGVDGLSQSISTTSSATNAGYGARITQYEKDLKQNLPRMRDFYSGLSMTAL